MWPQNAASLTLGPLEDIYGRATANTINSLTGTKIIFRAGDAETAKRVSNLLGEQEVVEQNESISFGAHQMRDGVSLNDHKRIKSTVSHTELLQLNDLEAYLKLPGNYPITRLKFQYHNKPVITQPFMPKAKEKKIELPFDHLTI